MDFHRLRHFIAASECCARSATINKIMKTRNKYLLAEATVTQPVGGAAPSFNIEPEYNVKKQNRTIMSSILMLVLLI
jgi:hypothetical protein